jgi:hypothetical protein
MVLRLWSRLVYNEESIGCELCRVGLCPAALLFQQPVSEVDGGTLIAFRHAAPGFVSDDQKAGMNTGWASMHERVRKHAEAR